MKNTDHNKKTRKRIKDLFVTEDEYLENKKAQAEELLKDAKNGKKCRSDEEKVNGKCKKKKKYGAYSHKGRIYMGLRLPDYGTPEYGDQDSDDNKSTSSDNTSTSDASASTDGGGDGGGGE